MFYVGNVIETTDNRIYCIVDIDADGRLTGYPAKRTVSGYAPGKGRVRRIRAPHVFRILAR
jgi:hypothetical protein